MARPRVLYPDADPVRVRAALAHIPVEPRDRWLRVASALKSGLGEDSVEVWDEWSRRSEHYQDADAPTVSRSLSLDSGVTLGTLFAEARAGGFVDRTTELSEEGSRHPPEQHDNTATLAGYAAATHLPMTFLRDLGLTDIRLKGSPVLRIPYRDRNGEVTAVRLRRNLSQPRGGADDHLLWRYGDTPQLYGLDRLAAHPGTDTVTLVERESDCHTLWLHGFPALGLPCASAWKEE